MEIMVEKLKTSKNLSIHGALHPKWKLRTYTIQIELSKIGFDIKKFSFSILWEIYTKMGFLEPGNHKKE